MTTRHKSNPKPKSKPKSQAKRKSSGASNKITQDDAQTQDDTLFRVGIALSVIRSRFDTLCSIAVSLEDAGKVDVAPNVALQAVAEKGIRECNEAIKTVEEARKHRWSAQAVTPRRRAADV